jgi:hypothetical protein
VKGIQVLSNKGSCPLQRGDNYIHVTAKTKTTKKKKKTRAGLFKDLMKAQIFMNAF